MINFWGFALNTYGNKEMVPREQTGNITRKWWCRFRCNKLTSITITYITFNGCSQTNTAAFLATFVMYSCVNQTSRGNLSWRQNYIFTCSNGNLSLPSHLCLSGIYFYLDVVLTWFLLISDTKKTDRLSHSLWVWIE